MGKSVVDGKQKVANVINVNNNSGLHYDGNATFDTLANAVVVVAADKVTEGYNGGVAWADSRANVNSANYQSGYNAGVAAADGRVLVGSASYNQGYAQGEADGNARCLEAIKNGTSRLYYGLTISYIAYHARPNIGSPTASIYSKIIGTRRIEDASGSTVEILLHLWCGVRNGNGWHTAVDWYF